MHPPQILFDNKSKADASNGWVTTPIGCGCIFGGGLRVFTALKVLLCSGDDASPQHWSVLRAIHTLNSRKNYIRLLGRLSPIHSTSLRGAQGLMWGTRGAFLLGAAMVMVVLVDAGCWRLTSDQPSTVAIVEIIYGSIFFIPT
jgi:hypothetical protein